MTRPGTYPLNAPAELDRLRLQARVWEPEAQALLDVTIPEGEQHRARPDVTGLTCTRVQVWGRKPA
jgi:hypothetical protein